MLGRRVVSLPPDQLTPVQFWIAVMNWKRYHFPSDKTARHNSGEIVGLW